MLHAPRRHVRYVRFLLFLWRLDFSAGRKDRHLSCKNGSNVFVGIWSACKSWKKADWANDSGVVSSSDWLRAVQSWGRCLVTHLLGFVVVETASAEHEPALDPRLAPQRQFLLLHQPAFALAAAEVLARDPTRRCTTHSTRDPLAPHRARRLSLAQRLRYKQKQIGIAIPDRFSHPRIQDRGFCNPGITGSGVETMGTGGYRTCKDAAYVKILSKRL